MVSSKSKALVIVFALFLFVGIITVGCKQKSKGALVDTDTMPGRTFKAQTYSANAQHGNSGIVDLSSDKNAPNVNFGPGDVSFDFRDLR